MPASAASIANPSSTIVKQKEWLTLLAWPLFAMALIGLLWANMYAGIAKERKEAERALRSQTTAAVNSYALQLSYMIEQIDQISLRLKYNWENPQVPVSLEKEYAYGLFPESRLLYANIFSAGGDLLTSTLPHRPAEINVLNVPYFQLHKSGCCAGLLISEPGLSRTTGQTVVRFTRRLNKADGSFNGVVVVAASPSYLVSFQENAAPGPSDFISVRLATGQLLASKAGQSSKEKQGFFLQVPVYASKAGIELEAAEKFKDHRARYVAWKKLEHYPLVALAGISVLDGLAPHLAEANTVRESTLLQTLLIGALGIGGALLSASFARRRRQAEETEETYRLATDAANEGFYMIRPIYDASGELVDFRLEDCNNRAAEFIGATRDKLIGTRTSQLKPAVFRKGIIGLCKLALERGYLEDEVRVSSRSPVEAKWIFRRIVRSSAGLALTIRDISAEKMREQALADLANTDTLTRLPNRNWLNRVLPDALAHASSRATRLAILFVDLDNFKNVNDTLGHDAGDELLVQAAQRLKDAVRVEDRVVRLGGDEFVVIVQPAEAQEHVKRVAQALVNAVCKPFSLTVASGIQVNASIGISLFPQDGADAETLLKHADIAMYAAKEAGKGRHVFYHPELSESLIRRLNKEAALREAVEGDQFVVQYQPRVNTHSGQITSMEALVRWDRADYGLVYPGEFIDMAEDVGLIVKIGELVIEKVCVQLAQWQTQGLPMIPVSINVSPQQLKSGTLSSFLSSCLKRHEIDPALIEAELTESAVIDRSTVVSDELAALRALGVKLMIDDFGTGYSSMAQLHRLDVDVLKVDRAFTQALCEGSEGKLLFGAIMSMAKALNITVVAEGVETHEELNVLKTLACNEIQGHIISRAVAANEMAQFMLLQVLLPLPHDHPYLRPA